MDWLTRHLPRSQDDERRERQTAEALTLAAAFLKELADDVRALQETSAEDRKGYPIANALKRRRPTDE